MQRLEGDSMITRESKYSFLYQNENGHVMRPESFVYLNRGRTLSSRQLRALGINKIKNPSFKRQASSNKRQAVPLWKPGVRVKNRFNRKV
jgi:hypothetical protein